MQGGFDPLLFALSSLLRPLAEPARNDHPSGDAPPGTPDAGGSDIWLIAVLGIGCPTMPRDATFTFTRSHDATKNRIFFQALSHYAT
jgi:hypothetical protein